MTTKIPSRLADNLETNVVPVSFGLDLDLGPYTSRKTLPWHTWSSCSVMHILFRFCERVEIRDPGVTVIFPCYVISALFVLW